MKNHICHKCGTENEEAYIYCKNCGTPLNTEKNSFDATSVQGQSSAPSPDWKDYVNPTPSYNGFVTETIDGIPLDETTLFVGKKANDICPKFARMEVTGSKTSWCWPLAILSFFFGPFGASLWFFYRKMYKYAAIFSVLGAILAIATSILSSFSAGTNIESFFMLDESLTTQEILNFLQSPNFILLMISSVINFIAEVVTAIVCGLYGFYWYKKHCSQKILTFRSYQGGHPYYKFGIASIGGVSGAMLTLGIVIMLIVTNTADWLSYVLSEFVLNHLF